MSTLIYILLAAVLDSLLGLVGIFSLFMNEKKLQKLIYHLVAFAAGAMLAGALLHMFPKALSMLKFAPELFVIGFLSFFIIERFLHWHNCHKVKCEVHPITYLTIIGDGIHNIIDGLVIAAAFLVDISLGILTTILIIAHEIPQELGNFAVLLHGGMKKNSAILWTFLSQATCIIGALLGYLYMPKWLIPYLIAFAGGGFLYIAASNLIPQLHEEKDLKKATMNFVILLLGILFLEVVKIFAKVH